MFKYLFEFVLILIIFFFIWNILKRIFFFTFSQGINEQRHKNNNSHKQNAKSEKKINQKLNWDAETVEYEEIKDDKKQ